MLVPEELGNDDIDDIDGVAVVELVGVVVSDDNVVVV